MGPNIGQLYKQNILMQKSMQKCKKGLVQHKNTINNVQQICAMMHTIELDHFTKIKTRNNTRNSPNQQQTPKNA